MLCKRAEAFRAQGWDPAKEPVQVSDAKIEKQRLFLESILVRRKVDELKSKSSAQQVLSQEFEERR